MDIRRHLALLITLALLIGAKPAHCGSLFPPAAAAQSSINFDGTGFTIGGLRTFIVSGDAEYARIPQALWADRLMRIKRAGFNCITLYTYWNYHEATSGQFNFTGNRNLDAYLKLAKSLGLYAIVRVGPYYCSEWDSGGYPIYLRFVPNLPVRQANSAFETYVTRWFNQLIPIVAANQIDRGGNVIIVQLENEDNAGWGSDNARNPYYQFLSQTALSNGLEVPYLFSGQHHGFDPAGGTPYNNSGQTTPWFSTEFWCDWINNYGESVSDYQARDRSAWKMIAYGANAYSHYMGAGGSNFDYLNDNEIGSSYDFGAPIGETGDLRPEYYKLKRAAFFARSFQSILETSNDATSTYAHAATNASVNVVARSSSSGTILFVDNPGTSSQTTKVNFNGTAYPQTGSLTVNAGEIMPIVTGYPVTSGVTLTIAPTRILGVARQASTTTFVIYGQAGNAAEMYFGVPAGTSVSSGSSALTVTGTTATLKTTYPSSGASNYSFTAGSQKVRILVVSDTLADDTWFVDTPNLTYVVCGPQYVGAASVNGSTLQITTESPWQGATNNAVVAYDSTDTPISMGTTSSAGHPGALALTAWQTMNASGPSAASFDTTGWYSTTTGPQPMGADGDVSADAWYRTTVTAGSSGTYVIDASGIGDAMIPYVDGVRVPSGNIQGSGFTANLSAGSHSVAIFTAHYGRDKFYDYYSTINDVDIKGITGPVYLLSGPGSPSNIGSWRVMSTTSSAQGTTPPDPSASGWSNYTIGTDAFNQTPGWAWFQTTLPSTPGAANAVANFASVDDNGTVYLNGKKLLKHTGWNVPFKVDLGNAWNTSGTNVLTVLVENTGGGGGIYTSATLTTYASSVAVNNWTMHGGAGDPNATTGWSTLASGATFNGPQFFKTTFTASAPGSTGANPMWRVTTGGLTHGSVWVNGHNLGRYPNTTLAPGVYIPECWLNSGANANTLVIYDEGGSRPDAVQIQPEAAASRDVSVLQGTGGSVQAPFGGTPAVIPGTVQAENYDTGGQGVAYSVTSVNGSGNGYRPDGVDLETTTDTGGGYNVGWTSGSQWFKYTVNVAAAGTYAVSFRIAAPTAVTDGFHLTNSSGTNISGNVNVPSTGGWQTWATVTANVSLSAGQQVLTLNEDNGGWNVNYVTFTTTGGGIANGVHTLTPQNSTGSRLDADGTGTVNGTKVQIWQSTGGSNQNWAFTSITGNVYTIQPSYTTGLCLDVSGSGTANGTVVDLWGCSGSSNEQWLAANVSGSVYTFAPQNAVGSRLDVSGAGTANGTQVQIWQANGGPNQSWAVN